MEGFFSTMAANNHQAPPPNHQRVSQTNVKQFKCDLCDKSFTQRRNQRAHIRTVHEKLKPFQCTHCGLTANRKFNLMSHIKKMHGSIENNSVIDRRLSGANTGGGGGSTNNTTSGGGSNSNNPGSVQSSANNHHSNSAAGHHGGHHGHHGGSSSSGSHSKKSKSSASNSHGHSHVGGTPNNPQTLGHGAITTVSQQCLVCAAPVKLGINKYFCDKCDQRFTTPVTNNAPTMSNLLSNVQGRNFVSPQAVSAATHHTTTPHPQTYRCLQCSFFTDDSNAMIGHHLHAHSSYPMPMPNM